MPIKSLTPNTERTMLGVSHSLLFVKGYALVTFVFVYIIY